MVTCNSYSESKEGLGWPAEHRGVLWISVNQWKWVWSTFGGSDILSLELQPNICVYRSLEKISATNGCNCIHDVICSKRSSGRTFIHTLSRKSNSTDRVRIQDLRICSYKLQFSIIPIAGIKTATYYAIRLHCSILKLRPVSWSSGQGLWLLIIRSRVRFPVLPWEFFPCRERFPWWPWSG